jgi:hypothetical protein
MYSPISIQRVEGAKKRLSNLPQDKKHFIVSGSNSDWRTVSKYTPWPMMEFHADTSFEINRLLYPALF